MAMLRRDQTGRKLFIHLFIIENRFMEHLSWAGTFLVSGDIEWNRIYTFMEFIKFIW